MGGWDGNLYCLNASSGESLWSYTTKDNISASPAISGGVVYITSWDRNVYALGASQATNQPVVGMDSWVLVVIAVVIVVVVAALIVILRGKSRSKKFRK